MDIDGFRLTGKSQSQVDRYFELLDTIWKRIQPTFGTVSIKIFMERAKELTASSYPFITELKITDEGVNWREFYQRAKEADREITGAMLELLINNLLKILSQLNDRSLLEQLMKEVLQEPQGTQ